MMMMTMIPMRHIPRLRRRRMKNMDRTTLTTERAVVQIHQQLWLVD